MLTHTHIANPCRMLSTAAEETDFPVVCLYLFVRLTVSFAVHNKNLSTRAILNESFWRQVSYYCRNAYRISNFLCIAYGAMQPAYLGCNSGEGF